MALLRKCSKNASQMIQNVSYSVLSNRSCSTMACPMSGNVMLEATKTSTIKSKKTEFDEIPLQKESKLRFFYQILKNHTKKYVLFDKMHQKYGRIFRSHLFEGCVFVSDIEAVEEIKRNEGNFPKRSHFEVWIDIRKELGLGMGLILT